jgi:hypothetical protein
MSTEQYRTALEYRGWWPQWAPAWKKKSSEEMLPEYRKSLGGLGEKFAKHLRPTVALPRENGLVVGGLQNFFLQPLKGPFALAV